jgi:hypothetical protein
MQTSKKIVSHKEAIFFVTIVIYYNFTAMTPLSSFIFVIPIIEEQKNKSGLTSANPQLKKGKVISTNKSAAEYINAVILYKDGCGLAYTHEGQEGLFFNLKHDEIISTL